MTKEELAEHEQLLNFVDLRDKAIQRSKFIYNNRINLGSRTRV